MHSGAWFNADAVTSPWRQSNAKRVRSVRPILLAATFLANAFGLLAVFLKQETLLTVYVFGSCIRLHSPKSLANCIVLVWQAAMVSDLLLLVTLLPHAFFLMRVLFDIVPVALALEARSHVVSRTQ